MKRPSPAPSRVTLEVDLSVLEDNFRRIRAGVAPLGVVAVLKADAYGLGMPEIARRLGRAGAAGIATAELAEALGAQAATGGRVPVGGAGWSSAQAFHLAETSSNLARAPA